MLELICKELGVEIGEEWLGVGVHQNPPKYKIQDNTLWIYHKYNFYEDDYNWKEASMADYVSLIKGELRPKWKPQHGEQYLTPQLGSHLKFATHTWYDHERDYLLMRRGLVFKTSAEAVEATNKMIESLKEER